MAEPAPAPRGALAPRLAVPRRPAEGRAHVTAARRRCGPLEGVSAHPRWPAPLRSKAAAPPGGSLAGGGRRGSFVTRTEKSGVTAFFPLLLLAPAASSVLWLASGRVTVQRAAPQPEVCPGSRAASSW